MEMQTFQALRYDSLESHIMVDQPTLHRCPMNYSMCETATLTSTTPRSTLFQCSGKKPQGILARRNYTLSSMNLVEEHENHLFNPLIEKKKKKTSGISHKNQNEDTHGKSSPCK